MADIDRQQPRSNYLFSTAGNIGKNNQTPTFKPGISRQPGNQVSQQFARGCPLNLPNPGACPFGGICHSCPVQVQTKIRIGQPGDKYEREADQVVKQMNRMANPYWLPEKKRSGFSENRNGLAAISDSVGTFEDGHPLKDSTRNMMDCLFGVNFDSVRLHHNEESFRLNEQLHAKAFTYGNHIWMGRGEGENNVQLMAHELTHVVQQKGEGLSTSSDIMTVKENVTSNQIQCDRLPCYSEHRIDVYAVHLPGASRRICMDLGPTNSILCQCGIELNLVGSEVWATDLLYRRNPHEMLNHDMHRATREVREMASYRPGGDALHIYYVPRTNIGNLLGFAFTGGFARRNGISNGVIITDSAPVDTLAHEMGHVLGELPDFWDRSFANNLMATGMRNSGFDELMQWQCDRMYHYTLLHD